MGLNQRTGIMFLPAFCILSVNLYILTAGHLVVLSPFILFSVFLLWWEISLYYKLALFKQPLFILWICFLLIISAQLLNTGEFMRSQDGLILIKLPKWRSIPFTFYSSIGNMTVITWLGIAGLCVASRTEIIKTNIVAILKLFIVLSIPLTLLGIIQYWLKSKSIVFTIPYPNEFFSVFPYVNNAGSFYILLSGLAIGLSWKYAPLLLLYYYSAWIINARFAMLCIPAVVLCKLIGRKMLYVFPVLVIAGVYVLIDKVMCDRWQEYLIGWNIFKDNFLWGIGINGTASTIILKQYAPTYLHSIFTRQPFSHCDAIVFILEYGFIAWGLLVAIAFGIMRKYILNYRDSLSTCTGLAVVMIVAHSLIDMPLRNPAVVMLMLLTVVYLDRRGNV